MPAPKRRRWFSLSLRTLLIGMTVVSVVFGWFLHQRQELFREKERIAASFGERSVSSPNGYQLDVYRQGAFDAFQVGARFQFGDSILGWDLPEDASLTGGGPDRWWWIRWSAGPRLRSAMISRIADDELLAQFPEVARHAKHIFLVRSPLTTSFLQDCLSDQTESLYINVGLDGGWIDMPADALTALSHSPRLKELTIPAASSGQYSLASWQAVFSHPSLEELQMGGEIEFLGKLPAVGKPNQLRSLTLQLDFPWPPEPEVERPFAWLSDCQQLTKLEVWNCESPWFLLKASQQCPQVQELIVGHKLSGTDFAALKNWEQLRRLELGNTNDDSPIVIDDEVLAHVADNCPGLESLALGQRSQFSAAGLLTLQRLSKLKRLEIYEGLTAEHVRSIARLATLEELSILGAEIDDAAAQPLKSLPRLKRICLDYTDVGEAEFPGRCVSLNEF